MYVKARLKGSGVGGILVNKKNQHWEIKQYVNRKINQIYLWEKASVTDRIMWQGASGAAGMGGGGAMSEKLRERGRERGRVCVCVCVCVCGKRERMSVQAREIVWRGREGSVSQSQHLSFSLHQGWGTLRPLASLAADLSHFHQRSHLFFSCFLLAACDRCTAFISLCVEGSKDLFIKYVGCLVLRNWKGDICRGQCLKLGLQLGLDLSFMLLEWIHLLLCCQCFVQGDRHREEK